MSAAALTEEVGAGGGNGGGHRRGGGAVAHEEVAEDVAEGDRATALGKLDSHAVLIEFCKVEG